MGKYKGINIRILTEADLHSIRPVSDSVPEALPEALPPVSFEIPKPSDGAGPIEAPESQSKAKKRRKG